MAEPCTSCGAPLAADALACSRCHALVHAARLKQLAAEVAADDAAGRTAEAAAGRHAMLALLPATSRQHALIRERLVATPAQTPARTGVAGGIVALVLGAWKLKSIVPMVATMLLTFGAYWTAYGWAFAAGLVLSIWVHEMGHVIELRRRGIAASLPMFIPGIGAYVRLHQAVPDERVDAWIGLAGPIAGTLAALACGAVYATGGSELWLGLLHAGALINLFNLTPLLQLDGARAFRAMSRGQRVAIALAFAVALAVTDNAILWLPLIVASMRLFGGAAPARGDRTVTLVFLLLITVLCAAGHGAR